MGDRGPGANHRRQRQAGANFARIYTNRSPATGVVIEYAFTTPKNQVTKVQLFNNGGNYVNDGDGIGTALIEVLTRPASCCSQVR